MSESREPMESGAEAPVRDSRRRALAPLAAHERAKRRRADRHGSSRERELRQRDRGLVEDRVHLHAPGGDLDHRHASRPGATTGAAAAALLVAAFIGRTAAPPDAEGIY